MPTTPPTIFFDVACEVEDGTQSGNRRFIASTETWYPESGLQERKARTEEEIKVLCKASEAVIDRVRAAGRAWMASEPGTSLTHQGALRALRSFISQDGSGAEFRLQSRSAPESTSRGKVVKDLLLKAPLGTGVWSRDQSRVYAELDTKYAPLPEHERISALPAFWLAKGVLARRASSRRERGEQATDHTIRTSREDDPLAAAFDSYSSTRTSRHFDDGFGEDAQSYDQYPSLRWSTTEYVRVGRYPIRADTEYFQPCRDDLDRSQPISYRIVEGGSPSGASRRAAPRYASQGDIIGDGYTTRGRNGYDRYADRGSSYRSYDDHVESPRSGYYYGW